MSLELFFILIGILNLVSVAIVIYGNVIVQVRNQKYMENLFEKLTAREQQIRKLEVELDFTIKNLATLK